MKNVFLLAGFFLISLTIIGQTNPNKYTQFIRQADSLYRNQEALASARCFDNAFRFADTPLNSVHLYNAACSWALANKPDSAFLYLNLLATEYNYTRYSHLLSDPDLNHLHAADQWIPMLDKVAENRKNTFPGLDRIQVNGFAVEIYLTGKQNANAEEPLIVFENGRGTSFEYWLPVIECITTDHEVFAWNRPRIGSSDDDNEIPTAEHMVDVLRMTLRQKNLQPPYLFVGHSWGGACIRVYAALYPDEVAGLIFVDPHNFAKIETSQRQAYREVGLTDHQIDSLYASYDRSADEFMAQGPKFVVEEMKAQRAFSHSRMALCNSKPLPDVPVSFIMAGGFPANAESRAGLYDPERMFRINNNYIIQSWLKIIEPLHFGRFFYSASAGHMVQQDDPELVVSVIKLALKDINQKKATK